jgi:hypothetical protein
MVSDLSPRADGHAAAIVGKPETDSGNKFIRYPPLRNAPHTLIRQSDQNPARPAPVGRKQRELSPFSSLPHFPKDAGHCVRVARDTDVIGANNGLAACECSFAA